MAPLPPAASAAGAAVAAAAEASAASADLAAFKRFLYIGAEKPLYTPPNTNDEKADFDLTADLPSLAALVDTGFGHQAVKTIRAVSETGEYSSRNNLLFALAAASNYAGLALPFGGLDPESKAAVSEADDVLAGAYAQAWNEIKENPEDFFRFFSYVQMSGRVKKTRGLGAGARRLARKFYNDIDPYTILRIRGKRTWSHKDVIKLTHVKGETRARSLLLAYVMKGFKHAQAEFEKYPDGPEKFDAEGLLAYLGKRSAIIRVEDPGRAAQLIRQHRFAKEEVHTKNFVHESVWSELLPQMPMREVFDSLKVLARHGFLEHSDGAVASQLASILTDQLAMKQSRLHPAEVFVQNKNAANCWDHPPPKEEASHLAKPRSKPTKATCDAVLAAADTALRNSFANLSVLKRRVLVAVDVRPNMSEEMCWKAYNLRAIDAAAITILTFVNMSGCQLTLGAYGDDKDTPKNLTIIPVDRDDHPNDLIDRILQTKPGPMDIARPVHYAQTKKLKFDAIITMTSSHTRCDLKRLHDALSGYSGNMKLSAVRHVMMAASTKEVNTVSPNCQTMLDVAGFNSAVPKVIAAFIRGDF